MDEDEAFEHLQEVFSSHHGRLPVDDDETFLFGMGLDDAALVAAGFENREHLLAVYNEACWICSVLVPPRLTIDNPPASAL